MRLCDQPGRRVCISPAATVSLPPAIATNANIVTIRELTKIFQQGEITVTALNQISLDIPAGPTLFAFICPRPFLSITHRRPKELSGSARNGTSP